MLQEKLYPNFTAQEEFDEDKEIPDEGLNTDEGEAAPEDEESGGTGDVESDSEI